MMMTTTMVLQFLGLLLLVVSLAGIARTQHFVKMTKEVSHSPVMVHMMSMMRVVIGLVLTLQPNMWMGLDGQIAGFLGAIVLVAGVFGLVFPEETMKMIPAWTKCPKRIRSWFFIGLVAGAALTMFGFGIL